VLYPKAVDAHQAVSLFIKYYLRKGTISIAFFIAALARFFLISYRADCFDAIAFFLFYYLCRSTNSRASLAA
jgi:hypothetical protein